MKVLRFFGIPAFVRSMICTLTALAVLIMPAKYCSTETDSSEYMLRGDSSFSTQAGSGWSVGFAKAVLTPDVTSGTCYIAGYNSDNPAVGVLDDMYARAVCLDDGSGRGCTAVCAVDCVGLSRTDINEIRALVINSGKAAELKSINICATHTHSAVDTQGLWGEKFYKSGRNEDFMASLRQKTADTIIASVLSRRPGRLYLGQAQTDMQTDCRTPIDYDKTLTRLRFTPDDGSGDIFVINFASHAELLGKHSDKISADFPAYMIEEIERQNAGSQAMFVNGAIGGMISAKEIMQVYDNEDFDCLTYMKEFGARLGRIALSITDEEEIAPLLNIASRPVSVKCDNSALVLARLLGVLNNQIRREGGRAYILSEVSYLELGQKQLGVFLIPGELYPELQSGNFLPADQACTGTAAQYTPLSAMTDCAHSFVLGLCNDELGYIVPNNDFMLHEWLPYFNIPKDSFGREHYEETNSVGPDTAGTLLAAEQELIKGVRGNG